MCSLAEGRYSPRMEDMHQQTRGLRSQVVAKAWKIFQRGYKIAVREIYRTSTRYYVFESTGGIYTYTHAHINSSRVLLCISKFTDGISVPHTNIIAERSTKPSPTSTYREGVITGFQRNINLLVRVPQWYIKHVYTALHSVRQGQVEILWQPIGVKQDCITRANSEGISNILVKTQRHIHCRQYGGHGNFTTWIIFDAMTQANPGASVQIIPFCRYIYGWFHQGVTK